GPVTHQAAGSSELAPLSDCRQCVTSCQHDELIAPGKEKVVRADQNRTDPLLNENCKGPIDLSRGAGVREMDFQPESAGGFLYLPRLVVSSRIGRIDQSADHTGRGRRLVEQLQSFCCKDGTAEPAGGSVAAGTAETCGKTILDRIGPNREHNRDRRSCGVSRECRLNSR